MLLLAILVPWLSFLLRGQVFNGLLCLVLQVTLIGWLPAAMWAVLALQNKRAERRTRRVLRAVNRNRS